MGEGRERAESMRDAGEGEGRKRMESFASFPPFPFPPIFSSSSFRFAPVVIERLVRGVPGLEAEENERGNAAKCVEEFALSTLVVIGV